MTTEGAAKDLPGARAEPLSPAEVRAWEEAQRRLRSVWLRARSGVPLSSDDLQLPKLDSERLVNALHVPDDAGRHTAALEAILRRIPDNWGRWSSCDRGWYPLIVDLDRQLAALDPGYILHQIKQKFGVLTVYIESAPEVAGAMQALIAKAAEASKGICEVCGAPGFLTEGSYLVKTLCPECCLANGSLPVERNR
jgi:hypothetical protein